MNTPQNTPKKKFGTPEIHTMPDMETDGVYFPSEIKDQLEAQRKELSCEYSGLPSVKAYQEIK